jgi:hypothetical protein
MVLLCGSENTFTNMEKQQTPVQWLFNQMEQMQYYIGNDLYAAYKEALEIERNSIQSAYNQGEFDCGCNGTAEDYYNKTYNEKL